METKFINIHKCVFCCVMCHIIDDKHIRKYIYTSVYCSRSLQPYFAKIQCCEDHCCNIKIKYSEYSECSVYSVVKIIVVISRLYALYI